MAFIFPVSSPPLPKNPLFKGRRVLSGREIIEEGLEPEADSLVLYRRELNAFPALSDKEKEAHLLSRVKKGRVFIGKKVILSADGREAQKKLIEGHLQQVIEIANRYKHCGLPLEDLIQIGNLGLYAATQDFRANFSDPFSVHVKGRIEEHIGAALVKEGWILLFSPDVSDEVKQLGQLVKDSTRKLMNQGIIGMVEGPFQKRIDEFNEESIGFQEPQRKALFDQDNLSHDDDLFLSERAVEALSDEKSEDPITLIDGRKWAVRVQKIVSLLSDKEREIINRRFGLPYKTGSKETLEEIAQSFGVTRERIRQIEGDALRKLRGFEGTRRLKEDIE